MTQYYTILTRILMSQQPFVCRTDRKSLSQAITGDASSLARLMSKFGGRVTVCGTRSFVTL